MADLDPFASVEELSAHTLGAISADDPRAADALARGSAIIRNFCGWHVAPSVEETLTLDGPGGRLLTLPSMFVTDISSITQCDDLVDPASYTWSALGLVTRMARWTTEDRGITVTLTHGHATSDAAKSILLSMVARDLMSPLGVVREQAGALSVTWSQTAPGVAGGITLLEFEKELLAGDQVVTV